MIINEYPSSDHDWIIHRHDSWLGITNEMFCICSVVIVVIVFVGICSCVVAGDSSFLLSDRGHWLVALFTSVSSPRLFFFICLAHFLFCIEITSIPATSRSTQVTLFPRPTGHRIHSKNISTVVTSNCRQLLFFYLSFRFPRKILFFPSWFF